jgi:hypothetical protein
MAKKSGAKILFGFLFFVILVGGLAGGGAWYLTENRAEGYRASATLLLPATDDGYGPIPLAGNDAVPEDGYGPIPLRQALLARVDAALGLAARPQQQSRPVISPPDYANLFSTAAMAEKLKAQLAETDSESASPTSELTLGKIQKAMSAEAQVALQTRDNVVYQRLLTLNFTADSPELAAAGANAWAKVARSFSDELAAIERVRKQQAMAEELSRLRDQIENAQEDMPTASATTNAIRQLATDLAEAQRARSTALESLEQRVARDEAALAMLKSYVSKAPVAVVLELSVKEAELDAALAGARAERDHLAGQIAEAEPAAKEAEDRWRGVQEVIAGLAGKTEETSALLARLKPRAAALEDALNVANGESPQLQIVAPAIVPDTPIGPHRYVLVGGAAALGAILGMIIYFALLTLRVYARELDRS